MLIASTKNKSGLSHLQRMHEPPRALRSRSHSRPLSSPLARAQSALLEFFAANIRNQRHAYAQATREFLAWCQSAGVASIDSVQPLHVPTYA